MSQRIQEPFTGQALQQLFRLTGRVSPMLEEYIVPTVQVADLSAGAQIPNQREVSTTFDEAAVVGQQFIARIEVPPGTFLHLRHFEIVSLGATNSSFDFFFGSSVAVPATSNNKRFTDQRVRETTAGAAGLLTTGTRVGVLAAVDFKTLLIPSTRYTLQPPAWVVGSLQPGQFGFMEFTLNELNARVLGSVLWDEYQLT